MYTVHTLLAVPGPLALLWWRAQDNSRMDRHILIFGVVLLLLDKRKKKNAAVLPRRWCQAPSMLASPCVCLRLSASARLLLKLHAPVALLQIERKDVKIPLSSRTAADPLQYFITSQYFRKVIHAVEPKEWNVMIDLSFHLQHFFFFFPREQIISLWYVLTTLI